jgi:hypothetical protein
MSIPIIKFLFTIGVYIVIRVQYKEFISNVQGKMANNLRKVR